MKMMEFLLSPFVHLSAPLIVGQLFIGFINGCTYAVLSLGLAIIFGQMHIMNFLHGAQFMMGAMVAWMLLEFLGIGYWPALLLAPPIVGLTGVVVQYFILRRIADLEPLYGFLLTFGLTLVVEGLFRKAFGLSGQPYPSPMPGVLRIGGVPLPYYRLWMVAASLAVCGTTWWVFEKTQLGARLRAATQNADLVQSFGINVPVMLTLTYGGGVALAAFAGVLAAPAFSVSPLMGSNVIVVIFAVVVFVVLLYAFNKTSLGLRMRAVTQNRRMAAAMGIRTPWVDAMTFALGSGIAGMAGVALSQIDNVSPNLGQSYIIDSFMVVVFGGVGNLWGTLVGALSLGIVNKFLEPYAGAVLGKIIVLVFIILFIQKRPRGLFALKGRAVEA